MAKNDWGQHKGGHVLYSLGILAIAYGVIQFLMISLEWPSYAAWIAGGLLLFVFAWLKKGMMK